MFQTILDKELELGRLTNNLSANFRNELDSFDRVGNFLHPRFSDLFLVHVDVNRMRA